MPDINAQARRLTLKYREVMKSAFDKIDKVECDQARGLPRGPLQKPYPEGDAGVELPKPDRAVLKKPDIFACLADRASRRSFAAAPLTLAELSYLLWATQGVRKVTTSGITLRTVPSGGAMHPFETYLAVYNVTGLEPGLYRYQPLDHRLARLPAPEDLPGKVLKASRNKPFMANCAAAFIWSAVPYRTEWRYTLEAKRLILQDSGHMCQNLYLACESIGCGTCAVGAYDQQLADGLLGLDGRDEFVIYMAPVGRAA
ncbi:MAG TPA: SagB/ThcOx family dehydrogenase [Elusimicrobiales bacterium]|nr:SagB/ThcOx family dehydrogenase [Elusimicrobiales bacterium]